MFCAGRPRAIRPRMSAPPMFPPPMNAAVMFIRIPWRDSLRLTRRAFARLRTGPEYRGADAYEGRSFSDRRLEVGAGPHRQGVQGKAMFIAKFIQIVEDLARLAKPLALA